ncbi:hypothetical protein [Mycobacterium sp. MMS18-G62]
MNKLLPAAIAGTCFALSLGLPAGANAAPSGVGSAQDTVNELENNGYKVVLNKLGTGPLDHCTVDSVRPGEMVSHAAAAGGEFVSRIVYQTVYLTAKC